MIAQVIERRDGYAVLRELRRRDSNFTRVAADVGVSAVLARNTAHGKNNNRRVLRRMLDMGVPPEVLRLPADLQETARGAAA